MKDKLYRCLDKLLEHREELFKHLRQRWEDLFDVKFEVLLYDLTSTYFESDPPFGEADKRKYGYSRDKRPDGVQVVIALVVTPEGFALAYEVMAGRLRTLAPGLTPRSMLEKRSLPPFRCWMCTFRPPTDGSWYSPVTLSRRRTIKCF